MTNERLIEILKERLAWAEENYRDCLMHQDYDEANVAFGMVRAYADNIELLEQEGA